MGALDSLFTPDQSNLPAQKPGDQTTSAWYSPLLNFMAQAKMETVANMTPQNAPLPGAVPPTQQSNQAFTDNLINQGHDEYNKNPVGANAYDTMTEYKYGQEKQIMKQVQITHETGSHLPTNRTTFDPGVERAVHSIEDKATADAYDFVYNSVKPHRRMD